MMHGSPHRYATRIGWSLAGYCAVTVLMPVPARAESPGWKAGLARVVITPEEPMWMGGYAARTKPSEGKIHDLYAKALAVEETLVATVERVAQKTAADPAARPARTEPLFQAGPLTAEGSFTQGIEGPACDRAGNVFAVNFARQQTIGRVTPQGQAEVYATLPGTSVGNGIRFAPNGTMFVADYANHNILRIDPRTRAIGVFAHSKEMNQPNDLAIATDGTLYISDPNWHDGTGQLWRIDPDGTTTRLAKELGTTNGIDVSPDGKTLYVNESVQRKVWAFPLTADKQLGPRRLLVSFPNGSLDGMRCDVDGNLYIARHGAGVIAKLASDGTIVRQIDVLGNMPSNLCFGGPDGRTVYVTEVEHRRLVAFRVDRPGLSWQRWQGKRTP